MASAGGEAIEKGMPKTQKISDLFLVFFFLHVLSCFVLYLSFSVFFLAESSDGTVLAIRNLGNCPSTASPSG